MPRLELALTSSFTLLCLACGSSSDAPSSDQTGSSPSTAVQDGGKRSGDASASGSASDAGKRPSGSDASTSKSDAGAQKCSADSPDQQGCACPTPDQQRACYTGPAATRGIGSCKDGKQTCVGSGEVGGLFSACTGETLPNGDSCAVTPPKDAGTSKCMAVSGMNGNGQLSDGTLFCEDDLGGGLGGIFGGFFGGGNDAGP